jgi:hypothetical protein
MTKKIVSYGIRILLIYLKLAAMIAMGTANAHRFTYGGF